MKKDALLDRILLLATVIAVPISLYLVFLYAPLEKTMGLMQKIFYYHVPLAWICFLAFFVVFVLSIRHLVTKDIKYDIIAHCSVQIGVLFCGLVLITGPIWARPIWGVWWSWDPRLTTTLILFMMYVGYLLIDSFTSEEVKAARIKAVFGIVAFMDVPIVWYSIKWWRTIHPMVRDGKSGMNISPKMHVTLLFCILTFTLIYALLLRLAVRVRTTEKELEYLKDSLGEEMI